jgi:hypothetical protein
LTTAAFEASSPNIPFSSGLQNPSYVGANEGMGELVGTAESDGACDGAFEGLRVGVMDGDWDGYSVG